MGIRSKGLVRSGVWSRRTRRNAVPLDKSEIGGLGAARIDVPRIGSLGHDFQTVYVQRCAPMRQIATDLRNEWRKARWIKLHLQERGAGPAFKEKAGRVFVAVGFAGADRKRVRVA